jgi:hypothetical protein
MKNKLLVGVITFFATIFLMILFLNIFDSDSKKEYSFDRKFNNKSILKFENSYLKTNENEHVAFLKSDNYIVERDKKVIDTINESNTFYFEDFNFKNKQRIEAILPIGSNILYCDLNKVIFTKRFSLFQYDFKTKITKQIDFKGLKVNTIKPIKNSETTFLCFAEYHQDNRYNTAFYIIDFKTKQIELSKELETTDYDDFLSNSLRYIGKFIAIKEKNIIGYYCEKYSKIFFFNDDGKFIKELQTSDRVPLPKIAKNSQGNRFYSQDGTWYSNLGIFMKDDKIYVFSQATKEKDFMTIDQYSWDQLEYIQSYKLSYKNINSGGIYNLHLDKNRVIICFDYDYASFKIL